MTRALTAIVGATLLTAAFASTAHAKDGPKGSCTSAAQVGEQVWKYAGPIVTEVVGKAGPHGATAAQIMKAIDRGVRLWNKLAGNSWAKIGPRRLDFDTDLSGNLVGVTERVFVSPTPAFRPVTLDFYKLDGKGTTKVVVCLVEQGRPAKLHSTFTVSKGTKKGKVRSVKLPTAAGKLVKVVLHGKKFGTVATKYRIHAHHGETRASPKPKPKTNNKKAVHPLDLIRRR